MFYIIKFINLENRYWFIIGISFNLDKNNVIGWRKIRKSLYIERKWGCDDDTIVKYKV